MLVQLKVRNGRIILISIVSNNRIIGAYLILLTTLPQYWIQNGEIDELVVDAVVEGRLLYDEPTCSVSSPCRILQEMWDADDQTNN